MHTGKSYGAFCLKVVAITAAMLLTATIFSSSVFAAGDESGPGSASLFSPESDSTVSGTANVTGSTDPLLVDSFFDVFICLSDLQLDPSIGSPGLSDAGCTLIGTGHGGFEGTLTAWDTTGFSEDSFFDVFVEVYVSGEQGNEFLDWDVHRGIAVDNEKPEPEPEPDFTPPVTVKTYGDPNAAGMFPVPTCTEERSVMVNVHFITTGTEITLEATDNNSGVYSTRYDILTPLACEETEWIEYETEWVGLHTHDIYQDGETCARATNNPETEEPETQECVETYWWYYEGYEYERPFTIPEESVHKICFYSIDRQENVEQAHCQIAVVDDSDPEVAVELDHEMIGTEYYSGGWNENYFSDTRCIVMSIWATDTHGIDTVSVDVHNVLMGMLNVTALSSLESFNQGAWEQYMADGVHNMPEAEFNEDEEVFEYEFCPGEHIWHLYDKYYGTEESSSVISWEGLRTFISEGLVLGRFEVAVVVTDGAGRESNRSVNLTVADLTVPLDTGWNLRSTPIKLKDGRFWSTEDVNAVLRWDSENQKWETVTDSSMEPLDSVYIHSGGQAQVGYVFEREQTPQPARSLLSGWNLFGPSLQLYDNLQNHPLTYLWDNWETCTENVLNPLQSENGQPAWTDVFSPSQELEYSTDWGEWYFEQEEWWLSRDSYDGCYNEEGTYTHFDNFGGYWINMESPATLEGEVSTPLPVQYGD